MTQETQVQTREQPADAVAPQQSRGDVAIFQRPRLPWHDQLEKSFGDIGISKATWKALIDAVFPAAKSIDSVVLALSYCKARKLDPFKRPVHIVPVWDSDKGGYVDTVWPGISELRTTAVRTGLFAGCDAAIFGPDKKRLFVGEVGKAREKREVELSFPEWAQLTVYRMVGETRMQIQGPRVYWEETYATIGRSELPNAMWTKRPRGQLEKCAEAAALRRAFPEELGNEYSAEEMEGAKFYGATVIDVTKKPQAAQSAAVTLDNLVQAANGTHDPETGEVRDGAPAAAQPEQQLTKAQPAAATAQPASGDKVADELAKWIDEGKTCKTLAEFDKLDDIACKGLDQAGREDLRGQWNNFYRTRKAELDPPKTAAKK